MADAPSKRRMEGWKPMLRTIRSSTVSSRGKTGGGIPLGGRPKRGSQGNPAKGRTEFVPSDSRLHSPRRPSPQMDEQHEGKLHFMACFGCPLVGACGHPPSRRCGDRWGHLSKRYALSQQRRLERRQILRRNRQKDRIRSKSILAMPIKIDDSVVGVIELINRKEKVNYDDRDLSILEILRAILPHS